MNKRTFITLALLCAVIIAAFAAGCAEQATTEEVRIGVVASMTGAASSTGKDIWQSAVLAAEEINAEGGIYVADLGKKVPITLIQGDDESTREGGQKAVSKLITQDGVDLLVGGFSSAVVSAHQSIVAEHQVPYIITGASTPLTTRRTDVDTSMMFHFCPTTDDYGVVTTLFVDDVIRSALTAKFDYPEERPIRLALIYQDSPFGKGQQTAVIRTIEEMNLSIEIVAEESFKMGETDFRTILTTVKAAQPDVIYPSTFLNEQISLVIQARRDLGIDTIFLAVECNDDPDYYTGLGTFGEYSVIESRFSPYTMPAGPLESPVSTFWESYKARWGAPPSMMGAGTYEGVYIAKAAIESAGTREKGAVTSAIATIELPQIIEPMQDATIRFTPDYREAKFELYMTQLYWDDAVAEIRPRIVWPETVSETGFVLPEWYMPGPP